MIEFKLHQHIDIALRPEVIAKDGPKKRELPNVMFLAEILELL